VDSISGGVDGRPKTYHVEACYTDGYVNLPQNRNADPTSDTKSSSFVPSGAWHLDWNVEPVDKNRYDLGVFTVTQTAEKVGPDGEFEPVPTASGLYHYWGGSVTNQPPIPLSSAVSKAQNRLEYDVGDMKNVSTKTAGGETWHLAEWKTDTLELPGVGAVATSIMSGQSGLVSHKGQDDRWDMSFKGITVPSYLRSALSAIQNAGSAYQGSKEQMIESHESTPAMGTAQDRLSGRSIFGGGIIFFPTTIAPLSPRAYLLGLLALLVTVLINNRHFETPKPTHCIVLSSHRIA
jgi:hypothetical protein